MASNLLAMVGMLSDEKSLGTEVVFEALEIALAAATRKDYIEEVEIRVQIDRTTGDYETFRRWEILADEEEIEFPHRQITVPQANERGYDLQVGDVVEEPVKSADIGGRIAAQTAKQVITQKVREAERARIYADYHPRIGSMVFGQVKRMDRGDAIVDIDNIEAILYRNLSIPKDGLRTGDRIRAILKEVRTDTRGPSLVLDRTCPELLIELFNLEVPETREGLVKIVRAARDPGQRAKIAVHSDDPKVDPIGACVGVRGARVQSVSNEIAGERVDIVKYSESSAQFVMNALAPATVKGMDVRERDRTMNVVVPDQELSQAIGRGGQNVRLATELTQWNLNIMTQTEADEKQAEDAQEKRTALMSELEVDEDVAEILVQEGMSTLDDIVHASKDRLMSIEEFDEELVNEIMDRAQNIMLIRMVTRFETPADRSPQEDLITMEGMDDETAWLLAKNEIYSMEDLANCASDELVDLGVDGTRAATLIMTAREPWFVEQPVSSEA